MGTLGLVSEIRDILDRITLNATPVLEAVAPPLRELMGSKVAGSYRVSESQDGRTVDFIYSTDFPCGPKPKVLELVRRAYGVDQVQPKYSVSQPAPESRNRVLHVPGAVLRNQAGMVKMYESLGVPDADTMRVLICHGSVLLAWVGAIGNPEFNDQQAQALQSLVPAFQRRLALERSLEFATLSTALVPMLLEQLGQPAFLLGPRGRVMYANTAAQQQLTNSPVQMRRTLSHAIQPGGVPGWRTVVVRGPGLPDHWLVQGESSVKGVELRMARAVTVWNLTRRQTQVLELIIAGDPNKLIAERLRCAPRTVEVHVTALLLKSGASSRSEMTARFWRLEV